MITGGGRGVTAAAAIALTDAYQADAAATRTQSGTAHRNRSGCLIARKSAIKRAILEHAGEKLHPREIEERYQPVIAGRELSGTLDKIAVTGGRRCTAPSIFETARRSRICCDEIRPEYGPIRGIVHGAGVLADHLISDKTREQFGLVYGTKVAGLRALLDATAADDLRFIALFSSTTGGFGRTGQVDYAVANEVLNKLAQDESRRRSALPDRQHQLGTVGWRHGDSGAEKSLCRMKGVGLIGLREGGELLVREIAATDAPVEIVALAETWLNCRPSPHRYRASRLTEAFSLTLSIKDYPFLRSHVLDGKAVLPDGHDCRMAGPWRAARQSRLPVPRFQRPAHLQRGGD